MNKLQIQGVIRQV